MRIALTAAMAALTMTAGMTVPAYAKPMVPDRVAAPASGFEQVRYRPRNIHHCYASESLRDCRERMRWEMRNRDRYNYRGGRYYERRDDGSEVAAAILGFALGAAIQGDRSDYDYYYSHRRNRGYEEGCRTRYSSYDRNSGTYRTEDGYRRYCRY